MEESVYALKPKIVVLLIGTNDFAMLKDATKESIYQNVLKIVNSIHEKLPKTKIILESIYPIYEHDNPKIDKGSVGDKTNKQIMETNELLKTISNVHYVDMDPYLKDERGDFILDYTMEGLHANSLGYHVITKVLKKEIDALLKE